MDETGRKASGPSSLFRPEAIRAQAGSGFGNIVLTQPISTRIVAIIAISLAAAVITFLFVGEYTRRIRVDGWLLPEQGIFRVKPPRSGVVRVISVREGDAVAKGDLLYILSSEYPATSASSSEGGATAPRLERLRTEQVHTSDSGQGQQVPGYQTQSHRDFSKKLEHQFAQSPGSREIRVTAPESGRIGAVLISPGQSVTPPQLSLYLLPSDSRLVASLYVPSSAVGLMSVGQHVKLRFAAFPFEHYGHQDGTIATIATSAIRAEEVPFPLNIAEPVFRVQVQLKSQTIGTTNNTYPLRAGMRSEADVFLDKHRLIEWIFEPLLGKN